MSSLIQFLERNWGHWSNSEKSGWWEMEKLKVCMWQRWDNKNIVDWVNKRFGITYVYHIQHNYHRSKSSFERWTHLFLHSLDKKLVFTSSLTARRPRMLSKIAHADEWSSSSPFLVFMVSEWLWVLIYWFQYDIVSSRTGAEIFDTNCKKNKLILIFLLTAVRIK